MIYEKNAIPTNAFIVANLISNKIPLSLEFESDSNNERDNKIKASNIKRIYI